MKRKTSLSSSKSDVFHIYVFMKEQLCRLPEFVGILGCEVFYMSALSAFALYLRMT